MTDVGRGQEETIVATAKEKANLAAVRALFGAWREGRLGFDRFLADGCLYETAGFPVLKGRDEILGFLFGGGMARVAQRYGNPALTTIRRLDAEVFHIVAADDLVFSERVDHHYDADGREVLSPRLAGVMEFDAESRCIAWRDYHDPAYFTGSPTEGWGQGQPTALAP